MLTIEVVDETSYMLTIEVVDDREGRGRVV